MTNRLNRMEPGNGSPGNHVTTNKLATPAIALATHNVADVTSGFLNDSAVVLFRTRSTD